MLPFFVQMVHQFMTKVTIEEICIENRQQDGISTKQIYQNKNIDINRIVDGMKDF